MVADARDPARPPAPATLRLHLLPCRGEWILFSRETHEALRHDLREESSAWAGRLPGVEEEAGESEPGGASRTGRAWEATRRWLRRRGGMGERILKEMRLPEKVEAIEVIHPSRLPEAEARRIFEELVESERRRSRRWLMVNGALLPVAAVLTLIPGPNVWAAYLAWRAFSHFRAGRGGRRADELPVHTLPEPGLDPLLELAGERFVWRRREKVRRIGEALDIHQLDTVL